MDKSAKYTFIVAIGISLTLTFLVVLSFQSAKRRSGTIVLPGGITYLGPTNSETSKPATMFLGKIPVPADAQWVEYKGKRFPYSFSYPETLSLGVFPNDPFDSVTVFLPNTDARENLFLRVESLKGTPYEAKSILEYAENWWRGYSWKGLASVTKFTNSKGLVSYRAKYLDDQGKTPYDHVFFEIPAQPNASQGGTNRPELVLWLSGKLLTAEVFGRIVDSVSWQP